jgi:cellulose synthase/poly-beta-1,6-N-acetylglucosamine synthase-like glycosyltransferase
VILVKALFYTSTFVIAYALVGYPLVCLVVGMLVRKRVDKQPCTPTVSIIIAAHNEEGAIRRKIENSLSLDYPRELVEIIVASDGSTDATDSITRSFSDRGVILYRSRTRVGKTAVLAGAYEMSHGEILVFTDATGMFCREALRELMANFHDPTVDCVTGRVAYRYGRDVNSRGFSIYQRFAKLTRLAENGFGSQTSVSGSIHAIRRELFRASERIFSHDVVHALYAVIGGKRVVYEERAVSVEDSRISLKEEYACRVRMGVQVAALMPYIIKQLVRNNNWGYLLQVFSHKLVRWSLWLFLLTSLISNSLLAIAFDEYRPWFAGQCIFYLLGVLGLFTARRIPGFFVLSPISFFLVCNVAMCVGAIDCIRGRRICAWESVGRAQLNSGSA